MARATRVDFPGAWYHVLNRGTERRVIFRSTRCCEKFIELLSSLPERFGIRLHGYALMGNHYHLQLESREANLSKALHWLNVSYSVWFNRKYSRVGPLFQGRFKAILHEPTEALKINRYIHLNPVRIAALGGHETRDVAAHEITAQLARPLEFVRFLRWNPSSTRLAMRRVHLGVLRPRLAMPAPKGVSSTVAGSGSHGTLGDGLEGAS